MPASKKPASTSTPPPNPDARRVVKATEWEVRVSGFAEAAALVRTFHYSRSTATTAVARHGLYRSADGILGPPLGAALWMPPLPAAAYAAAGAVQLPHLAGGVLVLSRLVVAPEVPANGASFLLGRSMRMIDRTRWPILLTFADERLGHTGAIYRATNWTDLGRTPGGAVWIGPDGEQRGQKRGPVNLSASAMRAAGFTRAARAGRRRFVHLPERLR